METNHIENDPATGAATRFTVESADGGLHAQVTISTELPVRPGLSGWVESLFAVPLLRKVYNQELGLIASKVIAYEGRRGQPKSGTDWRDVTMLLLFPALKRHLGPVSDILLASSASPAAMEFWQSLVSQEIQQPAEDD